MKKLFWALVFCFVFVITCTAGQKDIVFPLAEPVYINHQILCSAWCTYCRADMHGLKYGAVNYPAREGSPVVCKTYGKVIAIQYQRFSGNTITVLYTNGVIAEYCHLGSYVVHASYINKGKIFEGSALSPGDLIGYVGRTGRTTGPHLRYVEYVDGKKIFVNAETFGKQVDDFIYVAGSSKDELHFDFL